MEKLITTRTFPDPKDGEDLKEYMPRLLRWVEKELWFNLVTRINFLLDVSNDGVIEIIKEGNSAGDNGNWKIDISTGDFVVAERKAGVWVDSWKLSAN